MVRHKKGHKNSNGELAEWVIVSHKDGHIISSHKTKAEAEKHLGDIRKFKHMDESMQLEEAKELLESEGYIVKSFKDDLQLNEARKPKIKLIFGIRKRIPGAKCKPAFATFEEANEYMDKFTYPQDFEIVNLLQHPELLDEDFTQGVGAPLGADQGIPHSMQGCAVPMMRLGEPAPMGKIQKLYPGHRPTTPHKRHRPIGIYILDGNTNLLNYVKKKKKKKKSRKMR